MCACILRRSNRFSQSFHEGQMPNRLKTYHTTNHQNIHDFMKQEFFSFRIFRLYNLVILKPQQYQHPLPLLVTE